MRLLSEISLVAGGLPLGVSKITVSPDGKTLSVTDSPPPGAGSAPPALSVYDKE